VGWRDRDYAKWTPEERRRFLGSGTSAPTRNASYLDTSGRRWNANSTALFAVIVSAAIFAAGQLPRGHPLVPALHFTIPSPHTPAQAAATPQQPSVETITGLSEGSVGGFMTIHGQLATSETGTVTVEGTYDERSWQLFATVAATSGGYEARIPLTRPGLLHLRVTYPDGHLAVGAISVR
jgi:hypothetical protein